jgi:ribonuclease Z
LERAKETLHSTALQAATIASKANVKKLILGHFSARYRNLFLFKEEAQKIFKNTMIAKDGEIFEW